MAFTIMELTDEQKAVALTNHTSMDLTSLTRLVFGDDKLDARTIQGRSLKAFLAGEGKSVHVGEPLPKGPLELTPEQKRQIDQFAESVPDEINQLELAQLVFNDPTIKRQSRQWRAVHAYLKQVYPSGIDISEEPVEDRQFEPPNTIAKLVGLVNDYVMTDNHNVRAYDMGKLRASERRNLSSLMSAMRIYGFKYQASRYEKVADRELFLSTFIRWAHDKPDLTEIERDQLILAAAEKVNIAQIEREIAQVNKMYEQIMAAGGEIDEGNGKKRRFGMTDVELINALRTKYDAAKTKLERLMSTLEESRSKRIDARDKRNATFTDMVNQWQTDEEFREDMIKLGQKEKAEDQEEVRRLNDLSDVEALISGQTKEEGGRG